MVAWTISGNDMPRVRDGCVVSTQPLAALVLEYIFAWEVGHPHLLLRDSLGRPNSGGRGKRNDRGHFIGGDPEAVESAIVTLSKRTEEIGSLVPVSTIRKVIRVTHRRTELRVADALVTAMERVEVFHNGTL